MPRTNSSPSTTSRRGSAIIFDSSSQTVSTRKLTESEESRIIVERITPKWNSHVKIYVGPDEEKRLALTLNLDKLGWTTNMRRLCGKFKNIYVVDGAPSPLVAAS